MMSPEKLAKIALKGIHKNEVIICPMPMRRTMDIFFILFPQAHKALMRLVCKTSRKADCGKLNFEKERIYIEGEKFLE